MTKEDVYIALQFLENGEIQAGLAREGLHVNYKRLFDLIDPDIIVAKPKAE